MLRTLRQPHAAWRAICLTLAVLAVALKAAVPAGFMAAPSPDLPFALVICTSQGAVTLQPGDRPAHPGPGEAPDRTGHDSPCAFAGQAAGAPPPNLIDAAFVSFVAYRTPPVRRLTDLAPGRGLTAPPLPARGPPILLT